jgi:hypothetical protein
MHASCPDASTDTLFPQDHTHLIGLQFALHMALLVHGELGHGHGQSGKEEKEDKKFHFQNICCCNCCCWKFKE